MRVDQPDPWFGQPFKGLFVGSVRVENIRPAERADLMDFDILVPTSPSDIYDFVQRDEPPTMNDKFALNVAGSDVRGYLHRIAREGPDPRFTDAVDHQYRLTYTLPVEVDGVGPLELRIRRACEDHEFVDIARA